MNQVVDRHDELCRQRQRNILREKMHEIEACPPDRQRKADLLAQTKVAAFAERDVLVLGRDARQTRDQLARVRFHSSRELARQARIEPDARRAHPISAFRATTAG